MTNAFNNFLFNAVGCVFVKARARNEAVSDFTFGFLLFKASIISSCIASKVVEGYIASIASRSAVTTFAFFSLNFSKIAGTQA